MLFFSPIFLFFFLPGVFLLFFASRGVARDLVLLLLSCLFYFWAEPCFFPLALFSAVIDFYLCNLIFKYRNINARLAKRLLIFGISLNVLMLIYCKYMGFFIINTNRILGLLHLPSLPLLQILLPIGVSFIVFEKITYLVDIYKRKGAPANSLKEYLLYIFLFPKLLAGPIVKYHDIAPQLINHQVKLDDFLYGFRRFLLGLIKKLLIADTIAQAVNVIFDLPPEQLSASQAWFGMYCFAFQIYLDFSAYSDMAIGLSRMFGFRLKENFNMPLISRNITEFWQRWHISLSTWVRDYLYFPMTLGKKDKKKRLSKIRSHLNLFFCFLILGFWHGASWKFVLYGAYAGILLIIDKLFWGSLSLRIPKVLAVSLTFTVMLSFAGVLFRSPSTMQALKYYQALITPGREGAYIYLTNNVWTAIVIAMLISFVPVSAWYNGGMKIWRSFKSSLIVENWLLITVAIFGFMRALSATFNPFLYFRF